MNVPIELDIWKGAWGLPSVDLDCLEIMTYAKFSGAPLQTRATNNPFKTPTGKLPVFRHGKTELLDFEDISFYLKEKKNFSADFGITPKQQADVSAFSHLLREKLYPALLYTWWIDQKNYIELTRPWYSRALPLPLNYYYPGRFEREARKTIETLYENCEDMAVIEAAVFSTAENCLSVLSNRLGESEFFFGKHPTSLDATVYAYLAPLLKAPFVVPVLQNHLKSFPNLVKFVGRVTQRYFSDCINESESKSTHTFSSSKNEGDEDFPHKRRNQILAGLFATFVMAGYALITGLVQVTVKDSDSENQGNEYEELFDGSEESEQ